MLGKHVREANATSLHLDQQLTRSRKLELGFLDAQGSALLPEDGMLVGAGEAHFEDGQLRVLGFVLSGSFDGNTR